MKKAKKILIITAASVILLFLAICIGGGNYLINYAIGRGGDGGSRNVNVTGIEKQEGIEKTIQDNIESEGKISRFFLSTVTENTMELKADDGITLKGWYYLQPEEVHNWVILIHGYRSNHTRNYDAAHNYYYNGFNTLLPDLRACGESQGKFVGMGWLDRKDILKWINWITERDSQANIVIHGFSMGAATTMMVSGEETPENVKAFVEDCGYTSVWDIFKSELNLRFHLPPFPLLHVANIFSKIRAGYSFKTASALEQVKKCQKPMMFIHGSADDFVPFYMQDILYEAKPGQNKVKLVAEDAGHTKSMYALGSLYWTSVFEFLENYIEL